MFELYHTLRTGASLSFGFFVQFGANKPIGVLSFQLTETLPAFLKGIGLLEEARASLCCLTPQMVRWSRR